MGMKLENFFQVRTLRNVVVSFPPRSMYYKEGNHC